MPTVNDCKQYDCHLYFDCCPHKRQCRIDRNKLLCEDYKDIYDIDREIMDKEK